MSLEQIISQNTDEEGLKNKFESLPKNRNLFSKMEKLNTINLLIKNAKTSDLEGINNITGFFYQDSPLLKTLNQMESNSTKIIKIANVECIVYSYSSFEDHLSFRIILDQKNIPDILNPHRYRARGDSIDEFGFLYVFGNDIMIDTYIGVILEILHRKQHYISNLIYNYLTFFIYDNGYQIKENYDYNLIDFIGAEKEITANFLDHIISKVLAMLLILKNNEYNFNHGNLTCKNIFIKDDTFKMSNFRYSSISYNGIRFCNRSYINNDHILENDNSSYVIKDDLKSYVPTFGSYDVYIFMISLLCQIKVFNFFSKKNEELFRHYYQNLFSNQDLDLLWKEVEKNLPKFSQENNKIKSELNELMKQNVTRDLTYLTHSEFEVKYSKFKEYNYSKVKEFYRNKSNITPTILIRNKRLKININSFYDQFIKTNPSSTITDTSNSLYKLHQDGYFQLSNKRFGEYHLCIDKCQINPEYDKINPTCSTNKYYNLKVPYIWDYCTSESSVYDLMQYKVISKILSYYDQNGNLNRMKLDSDPHWRILLNMIFDNKLLIPNFDCKNDFIIKGKMIAPRSASRSIQLINVKLDNMYYTLNLQQNNKAIDQFIDNLNFPFKNRYFIKIHFIGFVQDIIRSLDKLAFAKVNAISSKNDDDVNKLIENEQKIYQVTNQLLYNNCTPNISSFLLSGDCNAGNTIYDSYKVKLVHVNNNNKKMIKMTLPEYFAENLGGSTIKSYRIFLLELLRNNITLDQFVRINEPNFKENNKYFNTEFILILVQIAYTLECFYRLGLVHDDLHLNNIFIETLENPVNLHYILTDRITGKKISKIISIKTVYFVRIFDFDRSYTFSHPTKSKHLSIKIPSIPKLTSGFIYSDLGDLGHKYDFSYVCRYIGVYSRVYPQSDIAKEIIKIVKGAISAKEFPNAYKNKDIEESYTDNSMAPIDWLNTLDSNNDTLIVQNNISLVLLNQNSSVYTLPDADLDYISNQFDTNSSWTSKTIEQKINICSQIIKNVSSEEILTKFGNLYKNNRKQIIVDWVRHGESCSNFDQKTNDDKDIYNLRPRGYERYEPKLKDKLSSMLPEINVPTKIKATWKYEPNLSYIGMQQAILLGERYVVDKPYRIILCSALTRSIMTALLACRRLPNARIYVVPYISEMQNVMKTIKLDRQNTAVNSRILGQRISFIKDWLENNWINYFDDIQIMQDLIEVKKRLSQNGASNLITNIDRILGCKPQQSNPIKMGICPNTMELMIQIITYLDQNHLMDNSFYRKYHMYVADKFRSFRRGPPVDLSILDKYEKIYDNKIKNKDANAEIYNVKNPNINLFYAEILPYMISMADYGQILCVSHGLLIKEIIRTRSLPPEFEKQFDHLKNTEVVRETIGYDSDTFQKVFSPVPIRTNYQNFESLNLDVCRTESLKGFLNFNLGESKQTVLNPTSDLKFYTDDKKDDLVGGEYQRKYIKYKSKYQDLKNSR